VSLWRDVTQRLRDRLAEARAENERLREALAEISRATTDRDAEIQRLRENEHRLRSLFTRCGDAEMRRQLCLSDLAAAQQPPAVEHVCPHGLGIECDDEDCEASYRRHGWLPTQQTPAVCPSCTGTGMETTDPEDASRCLDCGGTGEIGRH